MTGDSTWTITLRIDTRTFVAGTTDLEPNVVHDPFSYNVAPFMPPPGINGIRGLDDLSTVDVGHTWLTIESPSGQRLDVGTYPANDAGIAGIFGPAVVTFNDVAHAHSQDRAFAFHISPEGAALALAYIDVTASAPGPYNLIDRNCATFAYRVMRAAGADVRDGWGATSSVHEPWNLFQIMMDSPARMAQETMVAPGGRAAFELAERLDAHNGGAWPHVPNAEVGELYRETGYPPPEDWEFTPSEAPTADTSDQEHIGGAPTPDATATDDPSPGVGPVDGSQDANYTAAQTEESNANNRADPDSGGYSAPDALGRGASFRSADGQQLDQRDPNAFQTDGPAPHADTGAADEVQASMPGAGGAGPVTGHPDTDSAPEHDSPTDDDSSPSANDDDQQHHTDQPAETGGHSGGGASGTDAVSDSQEHTNGASSSREAAPATHEIPASFDPAHHVDAAGQGGDGPVDSSQPVGPGLYDPANSDMCGDGDPSQQGVNDKGDSGDKGESSGSESGESEAYDVSSDNDAAVASGSDVGTTSQDDGWG